MLRWVTTYSKIDKSSISIYLQCMKVTELIFFNFLEKFWRKSVLTFSSLSMSIIYYSVQFSFAHKKVLTALNKIWGLIPLEETEVRFLGAFGDFKQNTEVSTFIKITWNLQILYIKTSRCGSSIVLDLKTNPKKSILKLLFEIILCSVQCWKIQIDLN